MEAADNLESVTGVADVTQPDPPQFSSGAELARWTLENDNQGRALGLHPSEG